MKHLILVLTLLVLAGCSGSHEVPFNEPAFAESAAEIGALDESHNAPVVSDAEPVAIAVGTAEGFPFEYRDLTIHVGVPAEPILEYLGEPLNYFEAPSCAFEGIDRTYFYSGIELHTFPMGDNEYVLAVRFTDDSVETLEGVYLGMTAEEALELLGGGYEENGGLYTYTRGRGSLGVMTEHGIIVDLSYNFVVGE
jgi:hypothetical protein